MGLSVLLNIYKHIFTITQEGDSICPDDTPRDLREGEDSLVDGCGLSEEAFTAETTGRQPMRP